MSTESVYTCGLYLPGHDVHWIQARVSMRIETDPKREAARLKGAGPGHLVEVGPDGSLIVDIGGDVRRLWSHDPDRLERLAARNDGEISHQPGFGLLRTRSQGGSYLFCVADADRPDLRPCPAHPPEGDPKDLLQEAGGFSVPGGKALGRAETAPEPS